MPTARTVGGDDLLSGGAGDDTLRGARATPRGGADTDDGDGDGESGTDLRRRVRMINRRLASVLGRACRLDELAS